jgi:two-component system phosphate regulon sensor histidine kinase PhoR
MKPAINNATLTDLNTEILEVFPDPVVLLNSVREVIFQNKAAQEMLSIQIDLNLALSFRDPLFLEMVDDVLNGEKQREFELKISLPVKITLQVTAVAIGSVNQFPETAVMMVFHDVSSESISEKMRRDFVSNLSHELRSPIASLIGFIETLQGPAKDDIASHEQFLNIMGNEAQRMARMIDDLLSLSRVEASERVRPKETVEINGLLDVIGELLLGRAQKRLMVLDFDITPNLPTVQGDRDELMEVFQNLIDNAIKYGKEKTTIKINIISVDHIPEMGGPGVSISIINQGEGIKADQISRLTERFYRVDKGRSREMGGTGLGLAIVKHIINRHRGLLKIESNLNENTIFTVYLPLN